jgi:hypothetical protein
MVIKQQLEIDVFVNKGGAISIYQTDPYDDHDCPLVIVIQPENINLLIKALKNAKKRMQEDAGSLS